MTETEFLEQLREEMQRDAPVTPDMVLKEMPEWDSIAVLGVIGFFDESLGVALNADDFARFVTVGDLMARADLKHG